MHGPAPRPPRRSPAPRSTAVSAPAATSASSRWISASCAWRRRTNPALWSAANHVHTCASSAVVRERPGQLRRRPAEAPAARRFAVGPLRIGPAASGSVSRSRTTSPQTAAPRRGARAGRPRSSPGSWAPARRGQGEHVGEPGRLGAQVGEEVQAMPARLGRGADSITASAGRHPPAPACGPPPPPAPACGPPPPPAPARGVCDDARVTTTTVHLLRHGEVHNPGRVLYGRLPGFRLSDLGVAQARSWPPSSSPRARSRCSVARRCSAPGQTAAPLAEATGLPVTIDERLIEAANALEGRAGRRWAGLFRDPATGGISATRCGPVGASRTPRSPPGCWRRCLRAAPARGTPAARRCSSPTSCRSSPHAAGWRGCRCSTTRAAAVLPGLGHLVHVRRGRRSSASTTPSRPPVVLPEGHGAGA